MDPRVIPMNFLRHLTLLVVTIHLITCQQKSIVDKDNNIVLMPRDDINISLAIDGFDNNTFANIAQLYNDNVLNATDSTRSGEDGTETTTVTEEESDVEDSAWDPDMFTDSSSENADNSTSELEDIFNHKAEQDRDTDFISEDFGDNSITTPSTTTGRMSYIQKVPRRNKPYPSARRRRRQVERSREQLGQNEELENEGNHFLWVRAAPLTSVSQIENTTQENNKENNNKINKSNYNNAKSSTFTFPTPTSEAPRFSKSTKSQLGWVSQVLTEAMYEFSPVLSNNSLCQTHSKMYLTHLRNLTLWALKSKYLTRQL